MIITDKCNGKPVLFLSIDGILGPDGQHVPMEEFECWPAVCKRIGQIVRRTDAMVVISSGRIGKEPLVEAVADLVVPDNRDRMGGECDPAMGTGKQGMVGHWLTVAEHPPAYLPEFAAHEGYWPAGYGPSPTKGFICPSRWAVLDGGIDGVVRWELAGRTVLPLGKLTEPQSLMLEVLLSGSVRPQGDEARTTMMFHSYTPRDLRAIESLANDLAASVQTQDIREALAMAHGLGLRKLEQHLIDAECLKGDDDPASVAIVILTSMAATIKRMEDEKPPPPPDGAWVWNPGQWMPDDMEPLPFGTAVDRPTGPARGGSTPPGSTRRNDGP